jgi:uncharacterized protein YbbC (DUF1343 family)
MGRHVLLRRIRAALLGAFLQSFALSAFQLGIENCSDVNFRHLLSLKQPFSIGLISNQTARDHAGQRTVDTLKAKGVTVSYLLAPEHGFTGKALAGKPVGDGKDEQTQIPIVSVYGAGGDHTISGKRINSEILKAVDAVAYDIQDSGMRHYTYISTMLCALESCAEFKKPLYIFDRPNFLGFNMEGPLVESDLKSFISIASIPLRHGMTVGELAYYFNKHVIKTPAELHVVPMREYTRAMRAPFLAELSPNLLSEQSLYGYSFLGLLGEIRPFHVGVGSPLAFQVVMLPESKQLAQSEWSELVKLFAEYDIRAYKDRMMRNNTQYVGVRLLFPEKAPFASFELFLKLVSFFRTRNVELSFSPVFDKAIGTKKFKEWCKNSYSLAKLISESRADLQQFHKKAECCFLYEPHPKIKT